MNASEAYRVELARVYDTRSLSTRGAARRIATLATASGSNACVLDFTAVDFVSRSFANQLKHELMQLQPTRFVLENLAPDVYGMLDAEFRHADAEPAHNVLVRSTAA